MSVENITEQPEIENDEGEKVIIRLRVNRQAVADFLQQINAPFPPISDVDEVHLVVEDAE